MNTDSHTDLHADLDHCKQFANDTLDRIDQLKQLKQLEQSEQSEQSQRKNWFITNSMFTSYEQMADMAKLIIAGKIKEYECMLHFCEIMNEPSKENEYLEQQGLTPDIMSKVVQQKDSTSITESTSGWAQTIREWSEALKLEIARAPLKFKKYENMLQQYLSNKINM